MSEIHEGFYDSPRALGSEAVIDRVGANSTPILKVPFIIDVNGDEKIVQGEFWLSDNAAPFTFEKLSKTGWSGSLRDLASIGSKPCRVLVKKDDGGYLKVDGVWGSGQGGIKVSNPIDDAGLERLEAKMRGLKERSDAKLGATGTSDPMGAPPHSGDGLPF